MEALVVLLVELLAYAVYCFAAAAVAVASAAFELLVALIFGAAQIVAARRADRRAIREADQDVGRRTAPTPPASPPRRRWKRWRHMLLVPLAVVALASLGVQFLAFEPTLRWAAGSLAGRAGFAVEFAAATGNLYTGRVELRGLRVQRPAAERAGYDLAIAQASLDLDLWSLLIRPIRFQRVEIVSVSGTLTKPAPRRPAAERIKPHRHFVIDDLEIRDARLHLTGADGTNSRVEVIRAASRPLRSDLAVFDLFFRSNVEARIDGTPVAIVTEGGEAGRRTRWDIPALPASALAGLVPKPPFVWLEGGTITATVVDAWSLADDPATDRAIDPVIDLDWEITLSGVTVGVPADAQALDRITAAALAKVVNGRSDDVRFAFTLVLNREDFTNSVSLDAAGFWKALGAGIVQALTERRRRAAGDAASRIKSLLNRDNPQGE